MQNLKKPLPEVPDEILRGSGKTKTNQRVLDTLRPLLPPEEWQAFTSWLSGFYGYQQTWILDPDRFSASVKCRQIGGSLAYAGAATMWAVFFGETVAIVSIGEREAVEVLRKCKQHCEVLAKLGSKRAQVFQESQTKIELASEGRIMALPSTSSARGFACSVILDEFAYHTRPSEIYDAAAGAVTHGYRLRLISTPNGINRFADIIKDGPEQGWNIHQVTLREAIADGMPIDEADCWRQAYGDPRVFGQLFLCEFLDDNFQYIPSDLLSTAFFGYPEGDKVDDGIAYAGLDIGHTRDLTVLTIVRRDGDMRWMTHQESHRLTDDGLLDRLVAKAFNHYKCRRVSVDATGLGSFPVARLRRQWGIRLEPVSFQTASKEDLATRLYDALSSQEFKLPRTYLFQGEDQIEKLRKDIFSIRRVVTASGNVRYDAQATKDGHADRAWSLALALHAAGRQSKMIAALKKRMAVGR